MSEKGRGRKPKKKAKTQEEEDVEEEDVEEEQPSKLIGKTEEEIVELAVKDAKLSKQSKEAYN